MAGRDGGGERVVDEDGTGKLAVLTSGGDAPGMNAALRAVVRRAIYAGRTVYGYRRGFAGILKERPLLLRLSSVADIIKSGGTILRSGRFPAMAEAAVPERVATALRQHGVSGLVVIGGDGSMQGALALARLGVAVVGIPASIDNDIDGTDHSIGFDTAVNVAMEAMDRIRDTASAHDRVFVIEVMGRRCGAIALAAGLASGAEAILVPELPVDYEAVVRRLRQSRARGKRHSLIVVAEGAVSGQAAREEIAARTGYDVKLTILGHLQRGGSPTAVDRMWASRMGAAAVEWLLAGQGGVMAAARGDRVAAIPLSAVHGGRRPDLGLEQLAAMLAI